MKKIFSLILLMVTMMVAAVSANAAGSITLHGTPGSYYVNVTYPNTIGTTIDVDDNGEWTYTHSLMVTAYIYATEGYKLVSAGTLTPTKDSDGIECIKVSAMGKTLEYDVVSIPEGQETPTVTFNISAIGANTSAISMTSLKTGSSVAVSTTAKDVTVDEGDKFMISSKTAGVKFYRVLVNGEVLVDDYGFTADSYIPKGNSSVEPMRVAANTIAEEDQDIALTWTYVPEDGDVVVIDTEWPELQVPLGIQLSDGLSSSIVTGVKVGGVSYTNAEAVYDPENDDWNPIIAKPGDEVIVSLDTKHFTSISVNVPSGDDLKTLTVRDGQFNFLIDAMDQCMIMIEAELSSQYANYQTVYFVTDEASSGVLSILDETNNIRNTLSSTEYKIWVPKEGEFTVNSIAGYYVATINANNVDVDVKEQNLTSYTLNWNQFSDGEVITVTAVRNKINVTLNVTVSDKYGYGVMYANITLDGEEHEADENGMFTTELSVYEGSTATLQVTSEGFDDFEKTLYFNSTNIVDGEYNVDVEMDYTCTATIKVMTGKNGDDETSAPVEGATVTIENHETTYTTNENGEVFVTLSGVFGTKPAITVTHPYHVTHEGNLDFTENADHFYVAYMGTSTGIENVTVNEGADAPAYNLQGIRVTNPTKGIFIINGKKVLKK